MPVVFPITEIKLNHSISSFSSISFGEDVSLSSISFSGWEINLEDILLPDIRFSTLTSFLGE